MTLKESALLAGVAANVLMLVLPALAIFALLAVKPDSRVAFIGAFLLVIAWVNLACIRPARCSSRSCRKRSVETGYLGTAGTAAFGLVVAITLMEPILLIPLMVADVFTVGALAGPTPDWACLHCGYDMRGLPSETCPECGKRSVRDT